jgi:hypothetical protein
VPRPVEAFAMRSVFDLPFIELDEAFDGRRWAPSAFGQSSYLWRLLATRFPRPRPPGVPRAEAASEVVAARLVQRFVGRSRAAGSHPLVVYFPSWGDFQGQDRSAKDRLIARLAADGIEIHDPGDCLRRGGDAATLIVAGGVHYSDRGNDRMAECLLPLVAPLLRERDAKSSD